MRFICVYGIADSGKSHVIDSIYKTMINTVTVECCSDVLDHKAHGLISNGSTTKRVLLWSEGDGSNQIHDGFNCLRGLLKKNINIDVYIFTARIHKKTFAVVQKEIDDMLVAYPVEDNNKDVFWYFKSAVYKGNDCQKSNSLSSSITDRYNRKDDSNLRELIFL